MGDNIYSKTTINVLRIEKILSFSKREKGTFVFADYYIVVKSSLYLSTVR